MMAVISERELQAIQGGINWDRVVGAGLFGAGVGCSGGPIGCFGGGLIGAGVDLFFQALGG